jgi:hypothetical protein
MGQVEETGPGTGSVDDPESLVMQQASYEEFDPGELFATGADDKSDKPDLEIPDMTPPEREGAIQQQAQQQVQEPVQDAPTQDPPTDPA